MKFEAKYFQDMDERNLLARRGYQKVLLPRLVALPPGARVLDAGCGTGTYMRDLQRRRPDLVICGVDIADVGAQIRKPLTFRRKGVEKTGFAPGSFDFIYSLHVLEHLQDPVAAMQEFARLLKKGGGLYIEMPYYKTAYIPEGNMNFWMDPTHVRPHSMHSVRLLFATAGLRLCTVRVLRNWMTVVLGPYLLLKRVLLNDRDALSAFCAHVVGDVVVGWGEKTS